MTLHQGLNTVATKVQRGGEVEPDTSNKGSDADRNRHTYGLPEGVPSTADGPEKRHQGHGKTEDGRQERGSSQAKASRVGQSA